MKYKYFEVETEAGAFRVKAPANKLTIEWATKYALHWLKMQHGVKAEQLKNIKGA